MPDYKRIPFFLPPKIDNLKLTVKNKAMSQENHNIVFVKGQTKNWLLLNKKG